MRKTHIVWTRGDLQITVVNQFSPIVQRRQVERAGILANRDTKYDFPPYCANESPDNRNIHAFLLHKQNKRKYVIGLLLIEKRSHIWRTRWTDFKAGKAEEISKHPPMWSVVMIWVLQKYRGAHLGQTLVNIAVTYLGTQKQFGWYTEFTSSGESLARRCCPDIFYIAK